MFAQPDRGKRWMSIVEHWKLSFDKFRKFTSPHFLMSTNLQFYDECAVAAAALCWMNEWIVWAKTWCVDPENCRVSHLSPINRVNRSFRYRFIGVILLVALFRHNTSSKLMRRDSKELPLMPLVHVRVYVTCVGRILTTQNQTTSDSIGGVNDDLSI